MKVILEAYDPTKTYPDQKKFDCENGIINAFVANSLKQQVRKALSKAFVLVDDDAAGRLVGFYTMSAFMIEAPLLAELGKGSLPHKVSCVRLVMLGVDKNYKRQNLGRRMLLHAIESLLVVAERVGVFGLYLDADPGAVDFYLKNSFVMLTERWADKPTPMFLHIETARAALGQ
jgi:GNAT superfamily N-acetyltransferase